MGKKIAAAKKAIEKTKEYSLQEAISLVKKSCFIKQESTKG